MSRLKKRQVIRQIIGEAVRHLGLSEYTIISRIRNAKENRELEDCEALMQVNHTKRTILIHFNSGVLSQMTRAQLRGLVVHELLHSYFWEMSDLFDNVLEKSDLPARRKAQLKNRFERLEHGKIAKLSRVHRNLLFYRNSNRRLVNKIQRVVADLAG